VLVEAVIYLQALEDKEGEETLKTMNRCLVVIWKLRAARQPHVAADAPDCER